MTPLETAVGVIMRVPGLFIIDFWWENIGTKGIPNSIEYSQILNYVGKNLLLVHGFLLLLLPLRYVQALYTHLVSGALLFCCHLMSQHYLDMEANKSDIDSFFLHKQLCLLALHVALGILISFFLRSPLPVFSLYALPVVARLFGLPSSTLPCLHQFCDTATALAVFFYTGHKLVDCAREAYKDCAWPGGGPLLTLLWNRLFVPAHFALFWIVEFLIHGLHTVYHIDATARSEWYVVVLSTVSKVCSTPVSLVATSVSVSYLSFFILCCTRVYLQGVWGDVPSGWTEGLTLVLLSVQTGLMELHLPARTAVLTIILFIVLSSLMQSVLELAEPVVLALGTARGAPLLRHLRALILCVALLVLPLYLSSLLASLFPIDFWMMVVLSNCILTSVQVLDLLVVHCLFVYDSTRSEPWESLDEVVYYTRAITKVLEFLVAAFVVGMGLWESSSGKWTLSNVSILLIHCYFNVWQRLQGGWNSFLQRRQASSKARQLPHATAEQLATLDDVCSICYGEMKASACVTPCAHFFHRTCLRKWLYVQEKCPLCHAHLT